MRVVFERCDYQKARIKELADATYDQLSLSRNLHGKKILVKPNLISITAPELACTHQVFVSAIVEWLVDNGAQVSIGDSPAFGSCQRVCAVQGIAEAVKHLDVRIIEFSDVRNIELACGISVPVAVQALETDLLVGLPKIKAHNQMYVTFAVKNLFGTIRGMKKAVLHMVHGKNHDGFARLILDLVSIFPEQIHFADAISVMHRSGPMDGELLQINCFGAAKNPVALDTSFLHLLELDCRKSPLWHAAVQQTVEGGDIASIQFPLLTPEDFHGSGFIAPETLNSIRFNPLRFCKSAFRKAYLRLAAR